jgi:hypothetical protein
VVGLAVGDTSLSLNISSEDTPFPLPFSIVEDHLKQKFKKSSAPAQEGVSRELLETSAADGGRRSGGQTGSTRTGDNQDDQDCRLCTVFYTIDRSYSVVSTFSDASLSFL